VVSTHVMLCHRSINMGMCLSMCVTGQHCVKMTITRMMQTMPHSSLETSFLTPKDLENEAILNKDAKYRQGSSKSMTFNK